MTVSMRMVKITLRRARLDRGLTLRQLSTMSGVSMGAISRIENGGYGHRTTYDIAYKLVDAFGVGIEDIDWPVGLSTLNGERKGWKHKEGSDDESPRSDLCPVHFIKLPVSRPCDDCVG